MNKDKIYLYISAIVLALTLTFSRMSLFAWVSAVPFIVYINRAKCTFKEGYKIGFRYFIIFNTVLFSWILELYPLDWLVESSFMGIVILVIGWILLAIIESLVMAFIVPIYMRIKSKRAIINIFSISFVWILFEWVQSIGIFGMPWGRLAISQGYNTYLIQGASLFGILFISFLIMATNASIASYILSERKNKYLYLGILIFAINFSFGAFSLRGELSEGDIDVTLVQGNISSTDKWRGSLRTQVKKYIDLTVEGIENENGKPKIIVWPETAVVTNLIENKDIYNKLSELTKKYNSYLLTGAFYDIEEGNESFNYNSIYTIDKNGEMQTPYSKRHLVPFGEYIPYKDKLSKFIPTLEDFNLMGELDAGIDVNLQETEYGKIGGVICFESIFQNKVRKSVNEGAELIVLATNDSWFKDSSAVYQHQKQSIIRAVENNRYVVRAANTGISCFIDNKGRVKEAIPLLQEGVINSKVEMIAERTLYSIVGNLIVLIAFAWIISMYIINKRDKDNQIN
ncbi:MAG: apolipoprotein N-acyltransferase [Clostridium sp.]